MRTPFPLPGLCLVIAFSSVAPAQETASRPVLQAMKEELSRSLNILGAQPVPPYFLSYEITDIYSVNIAASFGALTRSNQSRRRQLDIDLRTGDYTLDNTHTIRGSFPDWSDRHSKIDIPIEDDADAIRSILWYYTDKKYKKALEQLTKVQTNIQVKVEEEDQSDDFSKESAEQYEGESTAVQIDQAEWEGKLKKYSAPFARYGDIYQANATLFVTGEIRRYVNSEGSEIQTSQAVYRLRGYLLRATRHYILWSCLRTPLGCGRASTIRRICRTSTGSFPTRGPVSVSWNACVGLTDSCARPAATPGPLGVRRVAPCARIAGAALR